MASGGASDRLLLSIGISTSEALQMLHHLPHGIFRNIRSVEPGGLKGVPHGVIVRVIPKVIGDIARKFGVNIKHLDRSTA